MSEASVCVGIDLGTTTTGIALYNLDTNKAEVIGKKLIPSIVKLSVDPKKPVRVGEAANRQMGRDYFLVYDAKRIIGRKLNDENVDLIRNLYSTFELTSDMRGQATIRLRTKNAFRDLKPQQISAEVLKEILRVFKDKMYPAGNCPNVKAVITIPANFTESQRNATLEAAKIADIEVIRLIAEPTAAAISYLVDTDIKGEDGKYIVFDFGGGTLDVSLVKKTGDEFEVLGTEGDTLLGGRDIDSIIYEGYKEILEREGIVLEVGDKIRSSKQKKKIIQRQELFKQICKEAKEELSSYESYQLNLESFLDDIDSDDEEESRVTEITISRDKIEQLLSNKLIHRILSPVEAVLKKSEVDKNELVAVLLAGGSSKIPLVRKKLTEYFGDASKIINSKNPDFVVSEGAAYLASKVPGKVIDCVPENLGVEVKGGDLNVILKKNLPLPANNTKNYTTAVDNQTSVSLQLYEGPKKVAKENSCLYKTTMKDIPPKPQGEPRLELTMSLDESGVLSFKAVCLDSNGIFEIQLSIGVEGRLTDEEIEQMKEGNDIPTFRPEINEKMKNFINEVSALEEELSSLSVMNPTRKGATGKLATFKSFFNGISPDVSSEDIDSKFAQLNIIKEQVSSEKSGSR